MIIKSKIKENSGLTLMELIITIAVTSIFFILVVTIIISTINAYNKIEEEMSKDSEITASFELFNHFVEKVNGIGVSISIEESVGIIVKSITDEAIFSVIKTEDVLIISNQIKANTQTMKLVHASKIEIKRINDRCLTFIFYDKSNTSYQKTYNIIIGVT